MGYHVEIELAAAKQLRKIERQFQVRIYRTIKALADEPRPSGCVKMAGMDDSWRVRVGDYRIVYVVADSINVVTVTKVGHRRDIYER